MKDIKTGFLLGIGAFIAFNVMGIVSTLAFYAIGMIINTFVTFGMAI